MILNTCNFIKLIEQVPAELDINAIEDYVIIIIITSVMCCREFSQSVCFVNHILCTGTLSVLRW